MRVFVSGATGYIGSRLVAAATKDGHDVAAGMRDPARASEFAWGDQVDAVGFDVQDTGSMAAAVEGCDTAFYLVHSMASKDFRVKDADGARGFAQACAQAGVRQVVYLSGLVPDGELSEHLASRLDVEQILLDGETPAAVLRAAVILGAGSTSFEVIRGLVARLPVLPMPPWMNHRVQPIATEDVVEALLRAAVQEPPWNGHRDLGGPERLTYRELVDVFVEELGVRRLLVPCPPLPHALAGPVVAWVTRIPSNTVGELVKSLRHDMVCSDTRGDRGRLTVREAVRRAMDAGPSGTETDGDRQSMAPSDPEWVGSESIEQSVRRSLPAKIGNLVVGALTRNR